MTLKQFEQIRASIESEPFLPSTSDPLSFGIERAAFECQKFKRLISATKEFATIRSKRAAWWRQLERAIAAGRRLEKLRAVSQPCLPNRTLASTLG